MNYLYQITNIINNKIYIGVHKTDNMDDGYMGSGKIINYAIKKYGIENFKKDILGFYNTYEDALTGEEEIVTDEFLLREDVYNLRRGGTGGFDYINKNGLAANTEHAKLANIASRSPESRIKRNKTFKDINHQQKDKNSQYGKYWISNPKTKEIKRVDTNDIPPGWVSGKKGKLITTCWVNNGIEERIIPLKEKEYYIENGYSRGRFVTSVSKRL